MDVREKLVEMSEQLRYCADVSDCANCKRWDKVCENQCVDNLLLMAADLIDEVANGVTVQEWISVKDRLPKMRDDGFADAFLVTDGSLAHIAYFVDGEWIFTDNGQMKEPMFYDVTHWLCLPQPPKGE